MSITVSRWSVNITPIQRVGRILVGAVGVAGGAFLLAGAGSALAVILEVLRWFSPTWTSS